MIEDFDKSIKIIVVGNGTVGKSSLILRFANGNFTTGYKKTIGVDFVEKKTLVTMEEGNQERLNFLIWDTAGQEEFNSVTRSYYRGAGAALIVFSVTDRASFEAIPKWHAKVAEECGDVLTAVVQNKIDLLEQAAVTPADMNSLQEKLSVRIFRTSVKDNVNVEEVFDYIASEHLRSLEDNRSKRENPLGKSQTKKQVSAVAGILAHRMPQLQPTLMMNEKGTLDAHANPDDDHVSRKESPTARDALQRLQITLTRRRDVPYKDAKRKSNFVRRAFYACFSDQT